MAEGGGDTTKSSLGRKSSTQSCPSTLEKIDTLKLADFDIQNKTFLGRGSFAKVFSVDFKRKPRRKVAIKYPFREDVDGPPGNEELRILRAIDHSNIIRFHGVIFFDDRTCFVMECAEHGSLHDVIFNSSAKIESDVLTRLQWTEDIAQGLAYLHALETPIVHGDVKSKNILVCATPDGQTVAKLADFGIATELSATTSDVGGCSFLWSAPEVRTKRCKSPRSDVWSYGATIIEMFTSKQPYAHLLDVCPSKNLDAHIITEMLTPLSDLPEIVMSAIPPLVQRILDKTLQLEYESRWTMQDVLTELTKDRAPPKVLLCTLCPWGGGQARFIATEGQRFVQALHQRAAAAGVFPRVPLRPRVLFFTEEGRWRPEGQAEMRRVVQRWDEEAAGPGHAHMTGDYAFVDPDSNEATDGSSWQVLRRRFLGGASCLPWSERLLPLVKAFTEVELLRAAEAPGRELAAAHEHAPFDLRFALALPGVKAGARLFWRLRGEERWCDAESGELFGHEKLLPVEGDRRRVFLFLKDQDPLPCVRSPEDVFLATLHRPGYQLRVEEGRLRAEATSSGADPEVWEMARLFPSEFETSFTAACRPP